MESRARAAGCLLVISVMGTGCAVHSVDSGAQHVRISREPVQDCQLLGTVIGKQSKPLNPFLNRSDLVEGATNDLMNKAHDMGATHAVVPQRSQTAKLVDAVFQAAAKTPDEDPVKVEGKAYRCGMATAAAR